MFSFFSEEELEKLLYSLKDSGSKTIKIEKEEIKKKFCKDVRNELTKKMIKEIAIENFKISKENFENKKMLVDTIEGMKEIKKDK